MKEVQNVKEKPWKNEELRSAEEALPRVKECHLEEVSRLCKAKTGVGVPLDLTKETRGEIVEFHEKVEQSGNWRQEACTTMFFFIPKSVMSERPIAVMPTLMRWWEACDSIGGGEVAAKVPRCLGRHGWSKRRSSTNSVGNIDGDGKTQWQSKRRGSRSFSLGSGSGEGLWAGQFFEVWS